jgi:subtilase family serine protease
MAFLRLSRHPMQSAFAAATVALLLATSSYAGRHSQGAIVGERVFAQPSATASFFCEIVPFDLSQGFYCYGPAAMRAAYNVNDLLNSGFTGAGQTIVILDAFGSPYIQSDLKLFDQIFGLPDPPSFSTVTMPGTPPFDPNNFNMINWSAEIALDVEWAHAMAPGANIVLVAAKSDFDQDLIDGLNYAVDHHLGSVVSMSFGESEAFLANPDGLDIVQVWTTALQNARQQHVTVLASSGDQGSATQGFPFQSVSWPASSPLVTSVGGTNLRFGTASNADPNGTYRSERVWNDCCGAGGGGMSILMPEPGFQSDNLPPAVNTTLHGHRGVPDVAYNAGVEGGVIVAWSAFFPGAFFLFGGTSAGAPQWAGIVADVNQARRRPLGFINQRLYQLGGSGALNNLFHDVTVGNNLFFYGIPGFPATPGYDLSTGWGTPNFGKLGVILGPTDE